MYIVFVCLWGDHRGEERDNIFNGCVHTHAPKISLIRHLLLVTSHDELIDYMIDH